MKYLCPVCGRYVCDYGPAPGTTFSDTRCYECHREELEGLTARQAAPVGGTSCSARWEADHANDPTPPRPPAAPKKSNVVDECPNFENAIKILEDWIDAPPSFL